MPAEYPRDSSARILVLQGRQPQQSAVVELLRSFGHQVQIGPGLPEGVDTFEAWGDLDAVLIVVEEGAAGWIASMEKIRPIAAAPPLVVTGSAAGSTWRGRALDAGAFVCTSLESPAAELRSALSAALLYRSLQRENEMLRVECERICLGLLQSYGNAAASLKQTAGEVEQLQENLRQIRTQIIRAFS